MKQVEMVNGDVVDAERPAKLRCTKCHGGDDEAPGGALTDYERRESDPSSVVRCAECGKKHSTDALMVPVGEP